MAGSIRDSEKGPEIFGSILVRRKREVVEIAVGQGAGGVATTTNMCPAGLILSIGVKVLRPATGGATLLNVGITGAGDADRFIDDIDCTDINDSGVSPADGDGATATPVYNKTATTLDLTTDGNATGVSLKVLVETTYLEFAAPN